MDTVELRVEAVVAGGAGLARDADGRVVFVTGGLPGEVVRARRREQRRDFARAEVVEVLEPSPSRVGPPCPHLAQGCGGCSWQHVAPAAQPALKAGIVADALRRTAGVEVPVETGPALPATGHRTTLRGVGAGGRFALRRLHGHDAVVLDRCLVAHPLVDELVRDGRFPDGEVVLRAGARTGEQLVVVDDPAGARLPEGVRVVGASELAAGRRAWFHEELAGRTWRVSARSFFQARPDGAEALVDAVRDVVADRLRPGVRLVDLYAGVGLFAGTVGAGARVVAVESSPSAVADARVNLADGEARIVRGDVARWHPARADVVVADPPRAGLGRPGVRVVGATGADRLALVACDAASLARDARLLAEDGWCLAGVRLVDMFPHTPHIEAVARFDRPGRDTAAG
ncbi:MAG: class I SAM-dependent RNA methyltransferase [Acidimicrobiia bacterium]